MIVAVGAGGNGGRREEGEGRMGLCAGHVWGRNRKKGQECSLSSGLTLKDGGTNLCGRMEKWASGRGQGFSFGTNAKIWD